MKRKGGNGSLTGGTGDVNPQFLTFSAIQSGADATTTTQVAVPIQRLPSSGRSQVMEVLKVSYSDNTIVETDNSVRAYLTTRSFGTTEVPSQYGEATVFDAWFRLYGITTSGLSIQSEPITHDLTDGVGHGILVATDFIFAQIASTGTGAAQTVRIKIMYRWKNVGLAEYIGLVQSQQGAN